MALYCKCIIIKLSKNENSIGHLPGGCRRKTLPQQNRVESLNNNRNALEQKAGFTVISIQCRNLVTQIGQEWRSRFFHGSQRLYNNWLEKMHWSHRILIPRHSKTCQEIQFPGRWVAGGNVETYNCPLQLTRKQCEAFATWDLSEAELDTQNAMKFWSQWMTTNSLIHSLLIFCQHQHHRHFTEIFYPRDAMLARSLHTRFRHCLEITVKPAFCSNAFRLLFSDSTLFCCFAHTGIVHSRAKAGSWNVHHLIAPWF